MTTGVVLLAAGSGQRLGARRPKQFLLLKSQPLFMSSVRVFASMNSVKQMTIVAAPNFFPFIQRWIRPYQKKKNISVVPGGAYRGESVRNGVRILSKNLDVVLVHDTARPLITKEIAQRVEKAASKTGVALAAWPLSDTLKASSASSLVKKTIPRQGLWLAQTPQGFRMDKAQKCLLHPSKSATDDVELAERKGFKVAIVEGSPSNMKVTYPYDLHVCRLLTPK